MFVCACLCVCSAACMCACCVCVGECILVHVCFGVHGHECLNTYVSACECGMVLAFWFVCIGALVLVHACYSMLVGPCVFR